MVTRLSKNLRFLLAAASFLCFTAACNPPPKQFYKLEYAKTPHVLKTGDRLDYGTLVQTQSQPTFGTLLIYWETPTVTLNLPNGEAIQFLTENLDGPLAGLESVFQKSYVSQASDGTIWLYGFEKSDAIYWIFQDSENRYGVPYSPRSSTGWTVEQTYSASLRRCPLTQPTVCELGGSFNSSIAYLGIENIDTPLAQFETLYFLKSVHVQLFDASNTNKKFTSEAFVYPGVGEVKFFLTTLESSPTQFIGEVGSTNISLPTIPSATP